MRKPLKNYAFIKSCKRFIRKPTENQLRWLISSLVIFCPATFVNFFSDQAIPRLIATTFSTTVFPCFLVILSLSPHQKPISLAPRLKGKYPEKTLKKWDIGLKTSLLIFAGIMFYHFTFPLLQGTYRLAVQHEPFFIIEDTVKGFSTSYRDPFALLGGTISMEKRRNESYFLWFPKDRLQVGEKYRFTILPGTDFVLDVEQIK